MRDLLILVNHSTLRLMKSNNLVQNICCFQEHDNVRDVLESKANSHFLLK